MEFLNRLLSVAAVWGLKEQKEGGQCGRRGHCHRGVRRRRRPVRCRLGRRLLGRHCHLGHRRHGGRGGVVVVVSW